MHIEKEIIGKQVMCRMEMIHVRVVDECREMLEDIAQAMEEGAQVAFLGASARSLKSLLEARPKNADMPSAEPGVDGAAASVSLAVLTDDMLPDTADEDARYFLLKPIDPVTLRRYVRLGARERQGDALRKQVEALCFKLGIPGNIQGFEYICEAVLMVVRRPELIGRITKELYPSIAARYGTTDSKVERSIRHAIARLWQRGYTGRINELFGFVVCEQARRMPNGEFIALLASRYRGMA